MKRTPLWQSISDSLHSDIASGRYGPGQKLPTEAELSRRFGVNRHTVRQAISNLSDAGLVRSRRGSGVFVRVDRTVYPIGKRVRFHQNLLDGGRTPKKEMLGIELRQANQEEAEALNLRPGMAVFAYDGLSYSDEVPIALFTSVFPGHLCPEIKPFIEETGSVTKALHKSGINDYTRASTNVSACRATATQALQLMVSEGAPLIESRSLNIASDGKPIEFGYTLWVGERVTLTLSPD